MTKLAALLLLFALVAPARADKQADALAHFNRGIDLFQAGDLAGAREALLRARDMVPDKPNPYRWLGLLDAKMGHCQWALEELAIFLKMVPASDPRALEAITISDRCRDELAPATGTLSLQTRPPGAAVRIDDAAAPVGTTPLTRELLAGAHVIAVQLAGREPVTRTVVIARRTVTPLAIELVGVAALAPAAQPRRRSGLTIGLAVGASVVALGLGLGLGLGFGLQKSAPTATMFPPVGGP